MNWLENAIFYHIYPLGLCNAPRYHEEKLTHRITILKQWIPHIQQMGFNAVYFGPLFESYEHGYDTSDYRVVDRRLGDNTDLKEICNLLHELHIHIVFDGVFNHVGREFWAFQDVVEKREHSQYCSWFSNLRFDQNNPMNDGFSYDTWQGYHNLIKLNLKNEAVISYLLESVGLWMEEFHLDGLRLDAADCVDEDFFKRLKTYTKQKNPDFWLMGEIIHGDYTRWANQDMLDSVTNYECYKGVYSSHNDKNYFEIAHSLQRQFAKGGIYEGLHLYNFVDNHDVNRIASTSSNPNDLANIYTLLYTMPGIPSVYYGSEWAIEGKKHDGSDADIRPPLSINEMKTVDITSHIQTLCTIRKEHPTLFYGTYEAVNIKNEQFVFKRCDEKEELYIALNVSDDACTVELSCDQLMDLLTNTAYPAQHHKVSITIPAKSSCILVHDNTIKQQDQPVVQKEEVHITNNKQEPVIEQIEEEVLKIGRYEHYKGKHYSVLYTAAHSETLEVYVVYRQLYGKGNVWIRPLTMFCENIEVNGILTPRFRYIGK